MSEESNQDHHGRSSAHDDAWIDQEFDDVIEAVETAPIDDGDDPDRLFDTSGGSASIIGRGLGLGSRFSSGAASNLDWSSQAAGDPAAEPDTSGGRAGFRLPSGEGGLSGLGTSEARFDDVREATAVGDLAPPDDLPVTALPHWTEPPTGQLPRIFDDVDPAVTRAADDELDVWGPTVASAARFRERPGDWDTPDFHVDELREPPATADPFGPGEEEAAPEAETDGRDELDDDFARLVEERRARARSTRRAASPAGGPGAPRPSGTGARAGRARALPGTDPEATTPSPIRRGQNVSDDVWYRLGAGIAMAAICLAFLFFGRASTAVLVTILVGLASMELFAATRRAGYHPATLLGIVGSAAMVPMAFNRQEQAFPLVGALMLAFVFLWFITQSLRAHPVSGIGVTLLGFGYLGLLGGFAGLVLDLKHGVGYVLGLAVCVVANDIAAYFGGRSVGRRPMAPVISPNKTWEGFICGAVASVLAAVILLGRGEPWKGESRGALLLGLAVAVAAPIGDLAKSALKRDLGIKDFGSLLPGHGGVLDRFDAILFCMPVLYYLVRIADVGIKG